MEIEEKQHITEMVSKSELKTSKTFVSDGTWSILCTLFKTLRALHFWLTIFFKDRIGV